MAVYLSDYHRIKQLEEWCNKKGLVLGNSVAGRNTIAIRVPHEKDSYAIFPSYSRGVSLVDGSVEDLLQWIYGYEAAMLYLLTIGIDEKVVRKHEDRIAGKTVMDALKKE